MPIEISKLPLMLCGPILRRVEPRLVSVFVVLKHPRKVTLTVYPGSIASAGTRPQPFAGGVGERDTVAVGKYLHVVVVTAQLTADMVTGSTYSYDIKVTRVGAADARDTGSAQDDLASLKLLEGGTPLGYDAGKLPTFAGPPADLSDLHIIHASCRKPHGHGRDMLPVLDTVIQQSRADPLRRPHQLFLTGDQIYADDVSGPLLFMLTETGDKLLGWSQKGQESLPVANVKPGSLGLDGRVETAKKGGISSSECANHLLGLGEFLAMYLFTWSDTIWPATLPTFAERFPEDFAWLEQEGRIALLVWDPFSAEQLKRLTLVSAERGYNKALPVIEDFRSGIANVRRALANVPTFMIFDDHEITDDWYLDRAWVEDVHTNELGRRVVLNGLLAYAVFQGWGNDPLGEFSPGKNGGKLLASLQSLSQLLVASDGSSGKRYDETNTDYNALRTLLRIAPGPPPPGGISWHYVVRWPTHHTLVLDTRTRREYVGTDRLAPPDLIGPQELARVVGPDQNGGALGPIVPGGPLTVVISPAPVIGHPAHETVANELGAAGASRFGDREMWLVEVRRRAFEDLLRRLSARGRVLILSGDVHYGHTATAQYWNERAGEVRNATIVQLVSSGCKNEDIKTHAIGSLDVPVEKSYLGWSQPGAHLGGDAKYIFVSGTPAVKNLPSGKIEVTPAEWRYRVVFSADMRSAEGRDADTEGLGSAGAWQQQMRDRARRHRGTATRDQMRAAVGYNNIGEVTFASNPPNLLVFQYLWFRMKGESAALPYTIHSASLTIPDPTVPRPTPDLRPDPIPTASAWSDLISFRPPQPVQAIVKGKGSASWYFHRIEKALPEGPVNLDYYPIHVTQLPMASVANVRFTAEELLGVLRRLLLTSAQTSVIDTKWGEFLPYHPGDPDESLNAAKWNSADPTGTVVNIKMKLAGVLVDEGSVICSRYTPQHWIFSTLYTPRDLNHPVSGNRMFGFNANGDGTYTFFTRGVDRMTGVTEGLGGVFGDPRSAVFQSADTLWKSFQTRLAAYVNAGGGAATVLTNKIVSVRIPWYQASSRFFSPKIKWDDGARP